jgi:MFS family permease|tara:strand:+ start:6056 stop:7228 length:1173 start_codon:yes stop_codon:yes gene_type:complete
MTLEKKFVGNKMLNEERKVVGVVALIAMFRMFGLFALLPVLSLYASELMYSTPFLIGISVGAYGLTQAIFQIPLGMLSDKIGRKSVICIGLSIFILGSLTAAYSSSIYGVIAGRFLQGAGAISATLTALLADATRKEVRTKSMAFLGIGIGSSFLIALIFGPLIAAIFGVRSLFFMAAFVAVIAMCLLLLVPSSLTKKNTEIKLRIKDAFKAKLLIIDLHVYLLHLILTLMFVVTPLLLLKKLQIPLLDHWKMYVFSLLLSLIVTIPMIMNDGRTGKRVYISFSIILLFLSQLIMTFYNHSQVMVFASLTIFFAGFNFLEASLPARLSILANDELRGTSLGIFSSFQFLGAFSGGLLGGWLMVPLGTQNLFIFTSILIFCWLLSLFFFED